MKSATSLVLTSVHLLVKVTCGSPKVRWRDRWCSMGHYHKTTPCDLPSTSSRVTPDCFSLTKQAGERVVSSSSKGLRKIKPPAFSCTQRQSSGWCSLSSRGTVWRALLLSPCLLNHLVDTVVQHVWCLWLLPPLFGDHGGGPSVPRVGRGGGVCMVLLAVSELAKGMMMMMMIMKAIK